MTDDLRDPNWMKGIADTLRFPPKRSPSLVVIAGRIVREVWAEVRLHDGDTLASDKYEAARQRVLDTLEELNDG